MRPFTLVEHAAHGLHYLRRYRRVRHFPRLDVEQIRDYQLRALIDLVRIAYERTGFYRRLYDGHGLTPDDIRTWADFERLPTIAKRDVMESGPELLTGPRRDRWQVSRSSGSSGQVLEIYSDTDRWLRGSLIMFRTFADAFGYRTYGFGRGAIIYTSKYPYLARFGLFHPVFLHTLTPMPELVARLVAIRPRYLITYPSILTDLIAHHPDVCATLGVRAIVTNSEQSTQAQRDAFAAAFGADVFDEYATEELGGVTLQCRHRCYHVQEDCSYLEILDPYADRPRSDDEVGEITGTFLLNPTMPLIRYRQGDLASLRATTCPCGHRGRELSDISGRKNSSFRLPDGELIPSGKLLDWTYDLLLELEIPLVQFQLTQTTTSTAEMLVVPRQDYPAGSDEAIERSFRSQFGDAVTLKVQRVDSIPRTDVGKHLPIRSLLA